MNNCYTCKSFYVLTPKEKDAITKSLGSYGNEFHYCQGVCIGSNLESEFFIKRFVFHEVYNCQSFIKGFSQDHLHLPCPGCHTGELVVARIREGHEIKSLFFSCDNYPECKYRSDRIKLNAKCKFCNSPLFLIADDILSCRCQRCNVKVNLPISPKIFPKLIFPSGECAHTEELSHCLTCQESRTSRKSLLDIELPSMIALIDQAQKEITKPTYEKYPRKYQSNYWGEGDIYGDPDGQAFPKHDTDEVKKFLKNKMDQDINYDNIARNDEMYDEFDNS